MAKYLFWDLDGTLTDSSEGITKSAQLALAKFGITNYELKDLLPFIGPPLRYSFPKYGVPEDKVEEAVTAFRSRYNTVGKYENKPFPGIEALLRQLKEQDYHLFVATSKPEILAKDILGKFNLSCYFDIICGSTMDGRIDNKDAVIEYLLSQIDNHESVLMIGDTVYDVEGAAVHNIPTIGVSWGFGDEAEMLEAGAIAIAHSMDDLYHLITSHQ